MFVVKPESYDPVHFLMRRWIDISNRPLTIGGSTQKDAARGEGIRIGTLEGMAEALSAFLTARRAERLPKWDRVGVVEPHNCRKFLESGSHAHDETYGKLPAAKDVDGYEALEDEAEKKFEVWYDAALENLVMPHDMAENELSRHREAVMKGEEAATKDDVKWLEEQMDEYESIRNSIKNVYDKIPTQD